MQHRLISEWYRFMREYTTRSLRLGSLALIFVMIAALGIVVQGNGMPTVRAAVTQPTQSGVSGRTSGRTIPTTSNPAGTGDQGVRTMANTSFEVNDSGCTMTTYEYARVADMRGWFTSHPSVAATCNGVAYSPARSGRVIELQKYAAYSYTPKTGVSMRN